MLFTASSCCMFNFFSHIFSFTLCLSPFHCDAYRLRLIPACLHRTSSKHHHIMKQKMQKFFSIYTKWGFIRGEDKHAFLRELMYIPFFQLPATPVHISVDVLKQPTWIIQSTSWLSQLDIASPLNQCFVNQCTISRLVCVICRRTAFSPHRSGDG